MRYIVKNLRAYSILVPFQKSFLFLMTFGIMAVLFTGCSSSTSASDEEEEPVKETQTFNLILSNDNSIKIGQATTKIITPDDDAYIDEGFFITLDISDSGFEAPFDITMNSGQCGTFDVQAGEKAEMPCNYDAFLSDPAGLTVISEDGNGEDAYPEEL